jgi:hypothetical protein
MISAPSDGRNGYASVRTVLERKTTPAALRQNYVHAHGLTLQALAIAVAS